MKHKAFTLIELLVVIAIIGLLATIVTVNVNDARNKANTAKSIQFSDNIYHSIGDNCVAYYDFNDTADGTLKDISGNNNTGTIHGAVSTTSLTYSGGNLGNALYFDGADDYVSVPDSNILNITDEITIEAWVKTTSTWKLFVDKQRGQSYGFGISGDGGNKLRFETRLGGEYVAFDSDENINDGIWHHCAATYSQTGTPTLTLYIDGVAVKSTTDYSGDIGFSSNNLIIGACYGIDCFFKGELDDVRIYSAALSSAEIRQHYAESLLEHLLAAGK